MTQKTLKTINLSFVNLQTFNISSDRTYLHLEQNNIFPIERKGYRSELVINKMILENCKKTKQNLSCAWIDYKNAFDNGPHQWILRSLKLFEVFPRVIGFLKHNMKKWKTKLTLTHESDILMSDNIDIKRGIFQGDSLSPLLFSISLIPLSLELNSSGYRYKIRTEHITHLLYMDDLKLYAKDDSELEELLGIVKRFSNDIGTDLGLSKCIKATF